MNRTTFVFLGAVGLGMAACSEPRDLAGPDSRRQIGRIYPSNEYEPVIAAPDTVHVGQGFDVVVNSFGSSSCTTPDGVDLNLNPSLTVITPYDLVSTRGPCTMDIAARPHPLRVHFDTEGAATIRARGYLPDEQGGEFLGSVSRIVVVQP